MSSPSQKVVIPKGLVNPRETTIVEIPSELHNVGTVVAKLRENMSLQDSPRTPPRAPPGGKLLKKSSYLRKTFPRPTMGKGMGMLHEGGLTFGGRDFEESADESSHGFHPYTPQMPSPPRTYYDFSPPRAFQSSPRSPRPSQSDPFASPESRVESMLYKSFQPAGASSMRAKAAPRGILPRYTPPSLDSYHSESSDPYRKWFAGPDNVVSPTSPSSYRKTCVTTEMPDGKISQTELEEESYEDESSYEPLQWSEYVPKQKLTTISDGSTPDSPLFTPSYLKDLSTYQSSGAFPSPSSPSPSSPSPVTPEGRARPPRGVQQPFLTQGDLMNSIGELESEELHKIMGDLNEFQNARRRLVFDASSLATAADVSSSIVGRMGGKSKRSSGLKECCGVQ